MPFVANVLRVMIASPSDVPDARDAVERAVHGWNAANAVNKGVVLLPWRWESSAVPVLGGGPQGLINSQGVDDSDVVFALFGSRLGLPTTEAVSGTVEEIERAESRDTPVHCYFSTQPLPNDVDVDQLTGLREFRDELSKRGLLGEFSSPSELEYEVWKAIEFDIAKSGLLGEALSAPKPAGGVSFTVQPQQEREVKGHSRQGKPQYRTRRWLEVTNTSLTVDAVDVVFESVGENSPMMLPSSSDPTVVHAGQTRTLPTMFMGGGSDPAVLRVTWQEDGETRTKDFHVG